MYKFLQNGDISTPKQPIPLVKENSFLTMEMENKPLPVFKDIKDSLPRPLWDNHSDYINAYYKAWEIAFGNIKQPLPDTKFVSNYIDAAFNNHIFMWDSCFMLAFGKYADKVFCFQNTLNNMYSHQHNDGFICRVISEEFGTDRFTKYDPSSTGPNVMAWCEWEYYLSFNDKDRLGKVFAPLLAYHNWVKEHFTWRDGSYFSTGWGCGMDNIPRLSPEYDERFSHGHMVWIDACLQALLSCKTLVKMANELDKQEYVSQLEQEIADLENIINTKLWDEKTGFYYDLLKDGKFNNVRHVGAFWSLIAECADSHKAQRLIEYLTDEKEFNTPTSVPTLSKSSPEYMPLGWYWRGGVWAPTNYMVLKGLDKYNRYDLSHKIGANYLKTVVDVFNQTGTFYENYAPEYVDGKGAKGDIAKSDFVGWTGIAPITVLFEYVFGIKPCAKNNKIIWHVELLEKHGIEQYPFGKDGLLTLVCDKRENANQTPVVTIDSNVPVELEIIWGDADNKQSMIIKK